MGNIGPFQLLIVLLIVLLVFGTKRIRSLGSDLGGAIREFRKGVGDDASSTEDDKAAKTAPAGDDKAAKTPPADDETTEPGKPRN